MKSKKGMENKVIASLLIAVTVLGVVAILFLPKILDGVKDVLGLSSSDSYCEETGLSVDQYKENMERALYANDDEKAAMYFIEYMECGLAFDKLILRDNEISVQLAEELCKEGYYGYSVEIFDSIPGEAESPIREVCQGFYDAKVLINEGRKTEAEQAINSLDLPPDSPFLWYIDQGDMFLEIGEKRYAYYSYSRIYDILEGSLEDSHFFEIIPKITALTNVKSKIVNVYLEILGKKMMNLEKTPGSSFCFESDKYIDGVTMSRINSYIFGKYKHKLSFNETNPDVTFNHDINLLNKYVCYSETQGSPTITCWNNILNNILPNAVCQPIIDLGEVSQK